MKTANTRLKTITNTEILNKDTGEIVQTTSVNYGVKVQKSDDFIMVFLEQLAPLFKIKQKRDIDVLFKLMPMAEYNTGCILLPSPVRKKVTDELDMDATQFSRSIRNLVTANLLSGERGMYFVNPKIFWKGTSQERDSYLKNGGALRFTIEFSQSGEASENEEVALKPSITFDQERVLTDADF